MAGTDADTYPSFAAFVEGVVFPRLLKFPERLRLDGWEDREKVEGNIAVAGRFHHDGDTWAAHEDCRFEPLLLAYWSVKARGEDRTFERASTKNDERLDLAPDLQDMRPDDARYLYLYRA